MPQQDTQPANQQASPQPSQQAAAQATPYLALTSEFDGFAGEVSLTVRFRPPRRKEVVEIAKAGSGKAYDAMRNALRSLVHPDDKAALDEACEAYPLLVTAYGDELFRRGGMGSVSLGK